MIDLNDYSNLKPKFSRNKIKSIHSKILVVSDLENELKTDAKLFAEHLKKSLIETSSAAANITLANNSITMLNASIGSSINVSHQIEKPGQEILQKLFKISNQISKSFEKSTQTAMAVVVTMSEINPDDFISLIDQKEGQLKKNAIVIEQAQVDALEQQYLHVLKELEIGFKPESVEIYNDQALVKNTANQKVNDDLHQIFLSLQTAKQQAASLQQENDSLNFDLKGVNALLGITSAIEFQLSQQQRMQENEVYQCLKKIINGSKEVNLPFFYMKLDWKKEIFKLNQLFDLLSLYLKKMREYKLKNPFISDDFLALLTKTWDDAKQAKEISLVAAQAISEAEKCTGVLNDKLYSTLISTKRFENALKSLNKTFAEQSSDLNTRNQNLSGWYNNKGRRLALVSQNLNIEKTKIDSLLAGLNALNSVI